MIRFFIVALIICVCVQAAWAQGKSAAAKNQPASADKITRTKTTLEVQGEISSITKRNISIIYSRDTQAQDENEIMLPYDKGTLKFEHMNSLSQLAPGDIVRVQYEENAVAGQGKDSVRFKAKVISFVRKAQPKVQAATVLDSGAQTAVQENQ